MPGEILWPTQPFPTKPAPFDYRGVTIDDLVDFTPEIRALAVEAVSDFVIGPLFTPPARPIEGGTQGTLMRPAGRPHRQRNVPPPVDQVGHRRPNPPDGRSTDASSVPSVLS